MAVNVNATINPKKQTLDATIETLSQDIEVDLSSSIIYAFSPIAKIEEFGDNYKITIIDKNGTTSAIIPVVTEENIDNIIDSYFQENPIIQEYIQEHNISQQAHEDIRLLIQNVINTIPTKVSELENDSKYVKDFKELLVSYNSYLEFPNIPPQNERDMIFLDASTGDMYVFGLNGILSYTSIGLTNQDTIYGGDSNY